MHYPRVAQFARVQGRVVLDLEVDASGKVVTIKLVSGHPILGTAAKANAYKWVFDKLRSTDSSGTIRLAFDFRLVGECATQCCSDDFVYVSPNRVIVTAPVSGIEETRP
ncbi:MAG: TonB family protein [Bryobacteraceae bacterium]